MCFYPLTCLSYNSVVELLGGVGRGTKLLYYLFFLCIPTIFFHWNGEMAQSYVQNNFYQNMDLNLRQLYNEFYSF